MASAQVKSAVLLAGLAADGRDRGPRAGGHPGPHRGDAGRGRGRRRPSSRGAPAGWSGCGAAALAPGRPARARRPVPGRLLGGGRGASCPGSRVTVERRPPRARADRVRRRAARGWGPTSSCDDAGGRTGSVTGPRPGRCTARWSRRPRSRRSTRCPILAVAAAGGRRARPASATSGELRVKESDRLAGTAELVRAFGGRRRGRGRRPGGRRARAGPVARARWTPAATTAWPWPPPWPAPPARPGRAPPITGWEAVATSYPGFADDPRPPGRGDAVTPTPAPGHRWSSPSTGRPDRASPPCRGRWPPASGSSGSTPGPCTGRWPGPRSTGGVDPGRRRRRGRRGPRRSTIEVGDRVVVDGTDVTEAIRGPEVSAAVSAVAANPAVRAVMVDRQRAWVAEPRRRGGRGPGHRLGGAARRRPQALPRPPRPRCGPARRSEEGAEAVARRDRLDSTRAASPLGVADGARVIDTGAHSVEEIVEEVVAWL